MPRRSYRFRHPDAERGSQRDHHPVDPAAMARGCRGLAEVLRWEHENKLFGPVILNNLRRISRLEAALSLEAQAARWEHEAITGERNMYDRVKIGMP